MCDVLFARFAVLEVLCGYLRINENYGSRNVKWWLPQASRKREWSKESIREVMKRKGFLLVFDVTLFCEYERGRR